MDLLSFMTDEELMENYKQNKTDISFMKENPMIFLNLLKDHGLIPEKKCARLNELKEEEKDKKQEALYKILENIEKKKSQEIRTFWECVSKEPILERYPILRSLYKKLEEEKAKERDHNTKQHNKKIAKMNTSSVRDNEPPGPSSHQTADKKKKVKESDLPSLTKKKKTLPVTCGKKKGKLIRCKFSARAKCIEANGKWFTPPEFEEHGGKGNNKKWKNSIKFRGYPLEKLIKDGLLKLPKKK